MFNKAEQIKEDFSEHSEKWGNLYLWCYWGIWGTQIIVLGVWVWRLYEHTCDHVDIPEDHIGSWVFETAVYSRIQTFQMHIYLSPALFQSAFIIFYFDQHSISSQNSEESEWSTI